MGVGLYHVGRASSRQPGKKLKESHKYLAENSNPDPAQVFLKVIGYPPKNYPIFSTI
jgi:hypothetical protein